MSSSDKLRDVALRTWDGLEAKRARILSDLRKIENEIKELHPAVMALLKRDKAAA